PLVLAMDIGSSSVRTAFFSANGQRCLPSTASRKYSVKYSGDGGAELDASLILRAASSCVRETLRWRRDSNSHRHAPIAAISGSSFWHSLLALDRAHQPLTPVYMWADTRCVSDAKALRHRLSERVIHARTGCMLRAPFWPAKLRWLRRTQPSLFKQTAMWVSPADWIYRELFGSATTSHSMANGTGLYNLKTATWDEELCRCCRVRPAQFDALAVRAEAAATSFPELRGVQVFAAIGDGAASNLGSGADRAGKIAITIGTSGAVREILSRREATARIPFGLFKYVVDEKRFVLGGAVSNGGNLREWFLREFQLSKVNSLSRRAAANDTLTILPFLVSERAPTWPEDLHGAITGLTPAIQARDLLRAGMTASFYRLAAILDQLEPATESEVIVSGGVLHAPASLAILADCLGRDIRISRELESSLRGAAVYALEQIGYQPTPLRPGRIVRCRPEFAALHRERRTKQEDLERRLR
ncbi:MAG: gluconokinase, partial [Chthoniobacterales bacterium]